MKRLVFCRDSERKYEVRIYSTGNDHSWLKHGELILNDKGNYELWTGTSFSSEGSGLENCSDESTEYSGDLDEIFETMSLELAGVLEIF